MPAVWTAYSKLARTKSSPGFREALAAHAAIHFVMAARCDELVQSLRCVLFFVLRRYPLAPVYRARAFPLSLSFLHPTFFYLFSIFFPFCKRRSAFQAYLVTRLSEEKKKRGGSFAAGTRFIWCVASPYCFSCLLHRLLVASVCCSFG